MPYLNSSGTDHTFEQIRTDIVGARGQKLQDKGEKQEVDASTCDGNISGKLEG